MSNKPNLTPQELKQPDNWKYSSPEEPGMHLVISPDNSACRKTWIYRINLAKGKKQILDAETLRAASTPGGLEINGMVAGGKVRLTRNDDPENVLGRLDSWYQTPEDAVVIEATENSMLYLGGAPYEGRGEFFVRPYDPKMPLGEVRQVHGKPPYRRDVFMTLNQETDASTMINGITWGDDGGWTSWPPHQHTEHLEEVYCYFDVPPPRFALHFASRIAGKVEVIHQVSTGDCVIVPEGYHPTAGCPGTRSCYFWVMAAHKPESRRYDLAVTDPNFAGV